jgi:hypothetical protein|tara:strand:- start:23 stop:238 length:216 start_codon:yes stop_codon:yes gene_type:complete
MPNMSYCRYENTARAMEDCIDTLMYSDCGEDLSVYETDALAQIQLLAMDIINLQDKIGNIIDNNKERFVTN